MRSGWGAAALAGLSLNLMGTDGCSAQTVLVNMRDGVQLPTAVYESGRKVGPSILLRTPYGRYSLESTAEEYVGLGYNVVSQDVRGTGEAEGSFNYFESDGFGRNQDAYDTLEWMDTQEWSNGQVCLSGGVSIGTLSSLAAGTAHPSVKCVYSSMGSVGLYEYTAWQGGAYRKEYIENLQTFMGVETSVPAVLAHPFPDDYWAGSDFSARYGSINAALYLVTGWYDASSQGVLDVFTGMRKQGATADIRGAQKLLVGPWAQLVPGPAIGEVRFPGSAMPVDEEQRWFERWLKNMRNGIDTEAAVHYYRMGDVDQPSPYWNGWIASDTWPVESSPQRLYLGEGGRLAWQAPQESASSSTYSFDPADPAPTLGGSNFFEMSGPVDQRETEARPDVVSFSSAPLPAPVAITGRIVAELFVASSAVDTDFVVKLTDVYPDGRSMLIQDGILRMRAREGRHQEVWMQPGEVYAIEVDLWSTSYVFNAGHTVRVSVTSSNYPRFSINPNTGVSADAGLMADTPMQVAEQQIYHDEAHPSAIRLPVVPLEAVSETLN